MRRLQLAAGAALVVALVLSGCGGNEPAHDPALWQQAEDNARAFCSLQFTNASDIYTDAFRSCVDANQQQQYDELVAERDG